jgi:hypothetical protein
VDWRSAFDARDTHCTETAFDSGAQGTDGVRLVATPLQYIDGYGSWHKGPFALLVTQANLIIVKPRAFGGSKTALKIPIANLRRFGTFRVGASTRWS